MTLIKDTKLCPKCDQDKPLEAFSKSAARKDGLQYQCKDCASEASKGRDTRNYDLLSRYGILEEDYDNMLLEQNFCCAICLKPASLEYRRLCVDHVHSTGKVRGLLCSACNTAIGKFQDDIERMESAINYLKKHNDPI